MKLALSILIIVIVLVGMTTIIIELVRHFKNIKKLPKASLMYKVLLLVVGLFILANKINSF